MSPTTVVRVTGGPSLLAAHRELLPGFRVLGYDGQAQLMHDTCDRVIPVVWPTNWPPLAELVAVAAGHMDTCGTVEEPAANCNGLCAYHCREVPADERPLRVGERPDGTCVHCGGEWTETTVWTGAGPRGWQHVYANHHVGESQ